MITVRVTLVRREDVREPLAVVRQHGLPNRLPRLEVGGLHLPRGTLCGGGLLGAGNRREGNENYGGNEGEAGRPIQSGTHENSPSRWDGAARWDGAEKLEDNQVPVHLW